MQSPLQGNHDGVAVSEGRATPLIGARTDSFCVELLIE